MTLYSAKLRSWKEIRGYILMYISSAKRTLITSCCFEGQRAKVLWSRRLRGSSGIIPGVYDLPRTNNNLVGVSRPSPPARRSRNPSSLSLDKPHSRRPHCINNEWRQPNFHCYIISYGLHAIGHATAIIISLVFAPCVRATQPRACVCVCERGDSPRRDLAMRPSL